MFDTNDMLSQFDWPFEVKAIRNGQKVVMVWNIAPCSLVRHWDVTCLLFILMNLIEALFR